MQTGKVSHIKFVFRAMCKMSSGDKGGIATNLQKWDSCLRGQGSVTSVTSIVDINYLLGMKLEGWTKYGDETKMLVQVQYFFSPGSWQPSS